MTVMKWSKLPKEKRNQLVLVVVGTLAVLGGLGFGLIKAQKDGLARLAAQQVAAQAKLEEMQAALKRAPLVEATLAEASKALAVQEGSMASGDVYTWLFNTVRRFQKSYKVDIPQLSPVTATGPVNLVPEVTYKQATMQVAGSAYYHDLGQFVAGLENAYPLLRVVNLYLEVNRSPAPGDREKLAFRMDLVTLVKPNQQ